MSAKESLPRMNRFSHTDPRPRFTVFEQSGWSYIEDQRAVAPGPTTIDGPYRYRWEAQEEADRLNAKAEGRHA